MPLVDLLLSAAQVHPDVELICLGGETRTNAQLLADGLRCAGAAAAVGVGPGDPVVLLVQRPSDFFPAFWGVILAGGVPVPLSGPRSASMEEIRRVQAVVAQVAGPVVVDRGVQVPGHATHDVGDWLAHDPIASPVRREGGVGLIQFSSGSTRDPKGALLSQDALLANVGQLAEVTGCGPQDTLLNWMPHFHDMGLIACHLMPLAVGMKQVRMDPLDIIRAPLNWLRLLSEHRATIATSTNFAVARVVDAIRRKGLPEGLDFSGFRALGNGGEPVSPAVCRAFSRLTGIPESVHWPVYGLAEACVGVAAFPCGTRGLVTREIDGHEVPVIGPPLSGIEVRVVGDDGRAVPDGEVGRLLFRGPNAYSGYLGGEPVSGWIDTGDLVVREDGALSIVGREKDLIIVNARNLHPHDVEYAAEQVEGVRPGGAVAVVDERDGAEALAVLVRVEADRNAIPVLREVRRRVEAEVGVRPERVWSVDKVPRTTSGKKRRSWLAKRLAEGKLDATVSPGTVDAVRRLWAEQLGIELGPDDLDTSFRELGGGSIQAVELVTRAELEFGVAPDLRLLTEGDTILQMARLLERQSPVEAPEARKGAGPVALIGVAMRLPGGEDLVSLGSPGPSRIGLPPDGRWGAFVGGYVDDPEAFDAARFGVDRAEAAVMDPQQRMVLTLAADLLPVVDGEKQVGVFVGAGQQAYIERILPRLAEPLPPGTMAANLLNMIAARVSHVFDLRGPALTVDTACSSALVALHLAARSLQAGECRIALAGGINLLTTPTAHRLFEVAGALSPTGKCTPFAGGDGMIPGEGAGLVLMAPLDEARARGWPVIGVLRGSAINNDGSSLGVMAPNPVGQEAVIRAALSAAGVDAESVSFVEAHGTGTPVGDAVEEAVLRRVYPHGPERGAVKGRIGHLLSAAGVAGLFHALAHLRPGALGAVSSFGFGGTNAHVILEGGPDRPERPRVAPTADGWVHTVRKDLAGGLVWTPVREGVSPLTPGLTVAITGGSGALGRVLTAWLRERYGAAVTWVGRSPPDALPDGVRFVEADVGDGASARRAAGEIGPVNVLFHLAGGTTESALRAKRTGAERLAGIADRIVLFSSISAVLPGLDKGIEAYAEANAALDAWAREQRALGRRVTSIAWPPWSGGGLAEGRTDALRGAGIRSIDPERAMAVLERAVASEEAHVVVLDRPLVDVGPLPDDLAEWLRERVADAAQLHPKQVGLTDPLPALGLDSVAALDLVKELEEKLGRKLPTTLAYEGGSLQGMLEILARGTVREAAPTAAPELLASQQTFVVQQRYFPEIPGNTLMSCRVSPGLDRAALARALDALGERHPAVRCAIRRVDGAWRRVDGAPPELRWVDAIDLQAVHEETFDLERGPVLRVVTDGEALVLDAHHALIDAWSLRNALLDLLLLHERALRGEDVALPALATTLDEATAAVAAGSGGDPGWWRARFAEPLPPLELPWSAPMDRPAAPPCHALRLELDRDRTAALEARARDLGVTLPALVLAAWFHALWRSSGTGDLAVRVAQGRREARLPDLERVVGSFADSLPVRVAVRPGEAVGELALRVAGELSEVRDRAGASAMGLAGLGERGGAGPVGLTPAGFSFPLLPAPTELGGQRLTDVFGASASGFTRVGLICWRFDDRLMGSLNALGSHLSLEACEALLRRVEQALDEAVSAPVAAATLHGRILDQARRNPGRPAVGEMSYGELARRSAALGARLTGQRVAVLAAPSEEAVVAVLGVMRAGAAYVPLDPGWPDGRIRQVLEVARAAALVTVPELAARAAGFGLPVVQVDESEADAGPEVDGPVAYVMFTSGTTGRPKGVVMSHRASLCFVDWCIAAFGLGEGDRLAQTSSLGFGGSIRQMFATLVAGGTVEPVPPGTTRDPDGLVRFLRERAITVWNSVPSLWTHLLGAMERTGEADPLPAVRWVLLGGEAVPAAHVRRWRERFGGRIRLANVYGSTETAHNATWFEVTGEVEGVHTPIGWSRAGTVAHLVDVVDGVGEIVVSGGIAEGYLSDPEQTAAAFVELEGIGRVYRTGDLARRRADGALIYLGRRDAQVQVRGNRVELGEIEHALCDAPGVRHALVTQREDGRLHAVVEGEATAEALRAWLADRLPAFMVPHTWEIGAELPRTAAGKRDRRALSTTVEAPATTAPVALVDELAAAWVAVLGLSSTPGEGDSFFALGGDSLTLLDVVERMRGRVAIDSPLPLYRHATLGRMAAWLATRTEVQATVSPSVSPTHASRERASVVERGFWLAHRADPEHPPLWTASVPLRGRVDLDALRSALADIARRHPMLRATWDEEGWREVLPRPEPLLQVDDLEALPVSLRQRAVEGRLAEAAALRLPMDRWAPWQVRICRLGPEEHVLVLAVHHAVADGWSAWQLTRELLTAHEAHASGRPVELPEPQPFVPAADPVPDPWWAEALADLPQAPAPRRNEDAEYRFSLDPGRWGRLQRAAASAGVSPFTFVASALFQVLQEQLGTADVVLSTALAARPAAAPASVGPYARALPVRLRAPATPSAVADALAEAADHGGAPPWQVVSAAGPDGAARLGRFFLTWLDPSAVEPAAGSVRPLWREGRYRFATRSTDTEVLVGALVAEGLHVHLNGGPRVRTVGAALEAELRRATRSEAALVVYAPDGAALPVDRPVVVEQVDCGAATSELVILPVHGSELHAGEVLERRVSAAVAASEAGVVALAGMLPALTGLATRPLGRPEQRLTTGHAATVVAMVKTVSRVLALTGREWSRLRVGFLGYGAIGQAVHALALDKLGAPAAIRIRDPRHPDDGPLDGIDLILGATSGGRALEVSELDPGTLVVDDSFPRCFDDVAARARMERAADVLLVGGGMIDAGPLSRWSPFDQAAEVRSRFPSRWLPGCHAEAVLLAARPELGPSVGVVDVERARVVWDAVEALGWDVPPLHLGGWVLPDAVIRGVST